MTLSVATNSPNRFVRSRQLTATSMPSSAGSILCGDRRAAARPAAEQIDEGILEARRDRLDSVPPCSRATAASAPHPRPRATLRAPTRPGSRRRARRRARAFEQARCAARAMTPRSRKLRPASRCVSADGGPSSTRACPCSAAARTRTVRPRRDRPWTRRTAMPSPVELSDHLPEFSPAHRIDADARLIEQQTLRLRHQCARETELLLHATGQAAREPRLERLEAREMQQPAESLVERVLLDRTQARVEAAGSRSPRDPRRDRSVAACSP